MARRDALDLVLRNIKRREDWASLAKVADCESIMKHYSDYSRSTIVEKFNQDIRSNFGHTLVNVFRGTYEPDYIEIICAVADKLKIPCKYREKDKSDPWKDCYSKKEIIDSCDFDRNPDIEQIEDLIIIKYFDIMKENIIKEKGVDAWERIEDDMRTSINKLHEDGKISDSDYNNLTNAAKGSIGLTALIIAGELSGFAIYQFSVVALFAVSKALGLGLTVAGAGVAFTSALGVLLGPIGWGITVLSLVLSLGGTSWKKTIPTVFMIACLRKQQKYADS